MFAREEPTPSSSKEGSAPSSGSNDAAAPLHKSMLGGNDPVQLPSKIGLAPGSVKGNKVVPLFRPAFAKIELIRPPEKKETALNPTVDNAASSLSKPIATRSDAVQPFLRRESAVGSADKSTSPPPFKSMFPRVQPIQPYPKKESVPESASKSAVDLSHKPVAAEADSVQSSLGRESAVGSADKSTSPPPFKSMFPRVQPIQPYPKKESVSESASKSAVDLSHKPATAEADSVQSSSGREYSVGSADKSTPPPPLKSTLPRVQPIQPYSKKEPEPEPESKNTVDSPNKSAVAEAGPVQPSSIKKPVSDSARKNMASILFKPMVSEVSLIQPSFMRESTPDSVNTSTASQHSQQVFADTDLDHRSPIKEPEADPISADTASKPEPAEPAPASDRSEANTNNAAKNSPMASQNSSPGLARFLFMGNKGSTKPTLPSKVWSIKLEKPKPKPKHKLEPTMPILPGVDTSPVSADPADMIDSHNITLPKRMREFSKKPTIPEKLKTKEKVQQSHQRRERRRVGTNFIDTAAADVDGSSHRPKSKGGKDESHDDIDSAHQTKRKKKVKLPKKGQEIVIPLTITVDGLAKLLGVPNYHLLNKMRDIGMDKLANDYLLSNEEAAEIALEYNVVPIIPENEGPDLFPKPLPEDMSVHPLRPPIVTIMGHVDHGKTTLLDTLRSSSITASEAGGITQHIGAFSVEVKGGNRVTFLDTPGHAAFSAMRARGANVTDIVVLIVAADDGVMPQTKEAIQHAHDADVPIIVAVNKCDKVDVDPSLIKEDLLQYGVQVEDFGGDVQAVGISALKGTGVDGLVENISTLAEVLDLRAEVGIPAEASIIESQLEKGRGNVASVLVKRGTLRVGDIIVSGTTWCKVRSMTDDRGKTVKEAGPSVPVKIMGWKDLPQTGDTVLQAQSEAQAKEVTDNRIEKRKNKAQLADLQAVNSKRRDLHDRFDSIRAEERAYKRAVREYKQGIRTAMPTPPPSKEDAAAAAADLEGSGGESQVNTVPVVIKGDVSGSVEAVSDALKQIPDKKIKINVIHAGVGPVVESDVSLVGSDIGGAIVAFNVKADKKTQNAAKRSGVGILQHRIIYKLLEDVEALLTSRLDPLTVEEVQGEAVVQQIYEITMKGNKESVIAGSRVTSGSILKNSKARVLRNGNEIFTGSVSSLKNIKKDINETTKGQEFGISFEGFEDMQEGDVIQSLRYKEVPQKLE